jgi:crotonobetainyl-CoA:carnitine CoA-transferase CaiB-like acyl-CoA transferase
MAKVLEGIRVLDLSRYAAGPSATMILADMGAEVIRVESPGGGEDRTLGPFAPNGESLPFGIILHRNKKGITLNLRHPRGQELLKGLVARADVVVENFSPEVKAELGLAYESLKQTNPAIIHVSITAFGQNGPYANRLAFDPIAQSMSGAMSYSGFPGSPPIRSAVSYVDNSTGIASALGAVLALYHRQRTGEGQSVDMALLDTAVSFLTNMGVAAEYTLTGWIRPQIGNGSFYAYGECFQAKDGWVYTSVIGNPLWRRFTRALGRDDMAHDARFKNDLARFENRQAITDVVAPWVAERTVNEVIEILEGARVPVSRVNNVPQMVSDPQVRARETIVEMDYPGVGPVPMTGVSIKLSGTPGSVETRAPLVGEHNREVYCGLLGLTEKELGRLGEEGVI